MIEANSFLFLIGEVVLIMSTSSHNVNTLKQRFIQEIKDVKIYHRQNLKPRSNGKDGLKKNKIRCN